MAFYFFYQTAKEQPWQIALDSDRARVISEVKPFLTSILACDYDFKEPLSFEEQAKVKYSGPFYADFDVTEGSTIGDVIPKVQEFLTRLKDKGLDLNSVSLFATGGKGFHVTIPLETFKEKVPKVGIAALPYIFREMAFDLVVDYLDLSVYSAKRGRMWRTANIERDNGKYKVPITVAEMFSMTEESYAEITSSPRASPPIEAPKFNPTLAVLFSICEDKVQAGLRRRKSAKPNTDLIKKYNGEWPATVRGILDGDNITEGAGFNRIALQLAITAHALGKSEKDLLRDSEGLCDKHQSDGVRYNTFRKRQAELSRMFWYLAGNPCFSFDVGPIKALVSKDTDTSDLTPGDYAANEGDSDSDSDEGTGIDRGIRINQSGFFVKTDEGFKKVSDIGITKPMQLLKVEDAKVIGYEVTAHVEGTSYGTHALTMHTLQTRARFMEWASGIGSASVQATDNQVALLMDSLRRRSDKNGDKVWIISREGVDIVCPYGHDPKEHTDVVWAQRDTVVSRFGKNYRLRQPRTEKDNKMGSDLLYAPDMEATPEMERLIISMFRMNSQQNMALMVGWFISCFLSQFIRKSTKQFPSLQVWGERGAGKTQTVLDLLRMHTFGHEIGVLQASGNTEFAFRARVAGSASVPVPIDEVKPRDMPPQRAAFLRDLTRNNYNGASMMRGHLNKDAGATGLELVEDSNAAPLIFLGEALETESAIMERGVIVAMSKEGRIGREEYHDYLQRNSRLLSSFGKACMVRAVGGTLTPDGSQGWVNPMEVRAKIKQYADEISGTIGVLAFGQDRPIHNLAVVMTGLEFGRHVVGDVFGKDHALCKLFEDARLSLLSRTLDVIPENISEAAKVIDTLSQMSRFTGSSEELTMISGKDYTVSVDGMTLDISMKSAYAKYLRYMKSLGQKALYDNYGAFQAGMKNYGAVVSTSCPDNPHLYVNPLSVVYRFSTEFLAKEKVEPFKC